MNALFNQEAKRIVTNLQMKMDWPVARPAWFQMR